MFVQLLRVIVNNNNLVDARSNGADRPSRRYSQLLCRVVRSRRTKNEPRLAVPSCLAIINTIH